MHVQQIQWKKKEEGGNITGKESSGSRAAGNQSATLSEI